MKKRLFKSISVAVSICLLITAFSGISTTTAAGEESGGVFGKGITLADVAAGLATPADLYGEIAPETVPAAVGLEIARERTHVRRLYEDEGENLNQVVFQNADGTKTLYFFDYPVKYVNGAGKTSDISLEIVKDDTKQGYFKNAAHSLNTTFSKKAADGIKLTDGNVAISLIPLDASTTSEGPVALQSTVARVDADTVAYTYNSKTSLEYSLTYKGFKEDIVVKEYTGQTEYSFKLLTGGLTLTNIKGSYYLMDLLGNLRASIGDIIIFTADERNNTFGRLTFKTVKARQEYIMTIHVDEEYLKDENTVYPIRIDPTIELNYDNYGTGAIHDVTLNSQNISNTASTSLSVGRRSNTWGISRILMKFPKLNLSSISSAAHITDANVELRDILCEAESLTVYCHPFTGNSWDENTVSWANVDANNYGAALSSHSISYSNGTQQTSSHRYAFDITTVVKGWKTGNFAQNKGILFKASNTVENGTASNYKTFGSYNRSAYRPALYVTYSSGTSSTLTFNDIYYVNNMNSGRYLYRGSGDTNVHGERGVLFGNTNSNFSPSATKWSINAVDGGYVIRNNQNQNQYLGVLEQEGYSGVRRITVQNAEIPNSCKWDISIAATGGCIIRNKYNSNYLYSSSNNTYTTPTLGSSSNYSVYTPKVWRIIKVDQITNVIVSDFTSDGRRIYKELENTTFFHGRTLMLNDSSYVRYTLSSEHAIWAEASDFSYGEYDNNIISIDYKGNITAKNIGYTSVTVLHKPTGISLDFGIEIFENANKLGTLSVWNDVVGDLVLYWPEEFEPEKIYIKNLDVTSNAVITSACQYAISIWNNALNLDMEITTNENSADIIIYVGTAQKLEDNNTFVNVVENSILLGQTSCDYGEIEGYYTYGGSKKLVAPMENAYIGIVSDRANTDSKAKWTALHELGHALGYIGHSGNSSDIMYYAYGATALSAAEIAHIKQIYDLR